MHSRCQNLRIITHYPTSFQRPIKPFLQKKMVLTSASEACVSPKIWHALVTLGYTVAYRTLAKFSLQPSLEATVGFCEVALASVDHLQRIFWHFKWVRETVEPAFVKVLKNRK